MRGAHAETLSRAVEARLPQVKLGPAPTTEDPLVAGDLVVELVTEGTGRWRLLVVDARGLPLLERVVSEEARADTALFETAALIVDRFLLEIDWKGRPATLSAADVAPAPALVLPVMSWWTVGVGGLAHLGAAPEELRGGPLLSASYRRDAWLVGVRLHFVAPIGHAVVTTQRPREVGQLREASLTGIVQGGYCLGEGTSGCAGLLAGARGTWAWADGQDLYSKQTSSLAAFAAGAFLSGSTRLPWQLEVGATLSATGFVGGDGFVVEGVADPVYRPSRFELALAVQLARRFF